jgi:hypothetical protein
MGLRVLGVFRVLFLGFRVWDRRVWVLGFLGVSEDYEGVCCVAGSSCVACPYLPPHNPTF